MIFFGLFSHCLNIVSQISSCTSCEGLPITSTNSMVSGRIVWSLARSRAVHLKLHYSDIIMSGMAITSISIVCATICAGADQRKHQSSASLAFAGDRWFPSQRASNAENISIWWRRHGSHNFPGLLGQIPLLPMPCLLTSHPYDARTSVATPSSVQNSQVLIVDEKEFPSQYRNITIIKNAMIFLSSLKKIQLQKG